MDREQFFKKLNDLGTAYREFIIKGVAESDFISAEKRRKIFSLIEQIKQSEIDIKKEFGFSTPEISERSPALKPYSY